MKIRSIEYENFRNFKEKGVIRCSINGKITIIYGQNGDGKTTLHQLFQWIIYGRVSFNKTSTGKLYNLSYEKEQEIGSTFDVFGKMDFEHNGSLYSVTRKYTYKKNEIDSKKIAEYLSLYKRDENLDWKKVDKPKETIEKILPLGLAEYFFFDGENMIADLRVKGKDSAKKLKKALFSMFDLDVIKSALEHIGNNELKTTVLGKLYLSQAANTSDSKLSATKGNIEQVQNLIKKYNYEKEKSEKAKTSKKEMIMGISEMIGGTKSKSEYETQRKEEKQQRESFIKNVANCKAQFGYEIMRMFPELLVSKTVNKSKEKINLKVSNNNLPLGINKQLINYLLKDTTTRCICGNALCCKEKDHLRKYLTLFPPKSYASLYEDFIRRSKRTENRYDKVRIEKLILNTIENLECASNCDKKIKNLDESEKNSKDIEELINARNKAENEVEELDREISKNEKELNKCYIYLKQQMKHFDELNEKNNHNKVIRDKIRIMNEVKAYFSNELDLATNEYSKKLEQNIQNLLNDMLTTNRKVSVSNDFAVRVTDSYDDESKSEGQFAIVSFAYIGGILNMLKENDNLKEKEYPLIMDGPFSKLDTKQKANVLKMLPTFAPQVVIFSKDDLSDFLPDSDIGCIWTIKSNYEKNIATVEEGFLWK